MQEHVCDSVEKLFQKIELSWNHYKNLFQPCNVFVNRFVNVSFFPGNNSDVSWLENCDPTDP